MWVGRGGCAGYRVGMGVSVDVCAARGRPEHEKKEPNVPLPSFLFLTSWVKRRSLLGERGPDFGTEKWLLSRGMPIKKKVDAAARRRFDQIK